MTGRVRQNLGLCSQLTSSLTRLQCRPSSTLVGTLKGDDLGPIVKGEHQSFRVRKDGSSKDLPLPPVLDSIVLEKRSRWEQRKQEPSVDNMTPFQKKLYENPYAHVLASPVRMCRLTSIQIPEVFLTHLHLRPHPETGHPWFLPVSLTTDNRQPDAPLRFIGRKFNVTYLGNKKTWERHVYHRILDKLRPGQAGKIVWREDMPELVLDLMRKRLVNKLRWSFNKKNRLVPCQSPRTEDIKEIDNISSVLIFRSLRTPVDDMRKRLARISEEADKWATYFVGGFADKLDPHASPGVTHTAPYWYFEPLIPRLQPRVRHPELEFKTTMWRGRKVAVYSLYDLLGEDMANNLIKGSQYEEEKCVVIKSARHNVPVEMLLMQLQAYIAVPGP